MSITKQVAVNQTDPSKFFALICLAYFEALAGLRRPEQLARWLSDTAYYDVCQRARRESKARELTGIKTRPTVVIRTTKIFLTDHNSYQGVVLLQIAGTVRAVSIRAELIHNRYRVTELTLV
jgi:hypothetical protein